MSSKHLKTPTKLFFRQLLRALAGSTNCSSPLLSDELASSRTAFSATHTAHNARWDCTVLLCQFLWGTMREQKATPTQCVLFTDDGCCAPERVQFTQLPMLCYTAANDTSQGLCEHTGLNCFSHITSLGRSGLCITNTHDVPPVCTEMIYFHNPVIASSRRITCTGEDAV